MEGKQEDSAPYIEVKRARLARSGKQWYSAQEMMARGAKVKDGKALYAEYRPPEVLIAAKEKFKNVVFCNDHTPVDVTPENWKQYAAGFVGGNVDVEVVDNEVYLVNDVVFFDKKAYEDYQSGKVELSASYDARFAVSKDPEKDGFDTVMLEIANCNHVALVDRGRAGHNARILDGAISALGGRMKSGFLEFLGLVKTKDENFKFSEALFASLEKVKAGAKVEDEISSMAGYVAKLGDSEPKELLAGSVAECYKNIEAVLGRKDVVGGKIDELYVKCRDADSEVVKRILDADGKKSEDGKDDGKDKNKKDGDSDSKGKTDDAAAMAQVIDAAVGKAFAKIDDAITAKVDAAMAKALGTGEKAKDAKKPDIETQKIEDSAGEGDSSWLVRGVFGNR